MKTKRICGFTLIELMFAVVALSFGLVGILRSFTLSLEGIKRTENIMTASELLTQKMEEIKQEAKEDSGIEEGFTSGEFGLKKNIVFSWNLEVKEGPTETLNEVKLAILWEESRGRKELEGITYLEKIAEE